MPRWTSCQSTQGGFPAASTKQVADVGIAVDDTPRSPPTRQQGCDSVSTSRCASRTSSGTPLTVGTVQVAVDDVDGGRLAPHFQHAAQSRAQPPHVGIARVGPRRRVQPGEFGERLGGLVGRVGAVAVEECAPCGHNIFGDDNAVLRGRVDVGVHAVQRAHPGRRGEVSVEERLRGADHSAPHGRSR